VFGLVVTRVLPCTTRSCYDRLEAQDRGCTSRPNRQKKKLRPEFDGWRESVIDLRDKSATSFAVSGLLSAATGTEGLAADASVA